MKSRANQYNRFFNNTMLLSLVFQVGLISRCSSSQQQSATGEPVQNGLDNSAGQNASLNSAAKNPAKNAAQQGEAINNAVSAGSTNDFAGMNNSANANAALGESLNNAPVENATAMSTNATTNMPANSTPLNSTMPTNQAAAPTNPAAGNIAAINTAAQSATTTPAEPAGAAPVATAPDISARFAASPFVNPHMNWPGKGKVKYITRQATKHAGPNGPVVGEYAQGEHPLVFQNGNWVELHDGSFVKGNSMTDSPVGYSKGH